MDNDTILERIIEKRQRLDELKMQSPEATEAVQLAGDLTCLFEQLSAGGQIRYVPYPVYPSYPATYPFWTSISAGNTTGLNPSAMGGVTTYIAPDTTTGKSWGR